MPLKYQMYLNEGIISSLFVVMAFSFNGRNTIFFT